MDLNDGRPQFQVQKLSKSAKRRRRRSPLYKALKDLIGADSRGTQIAQMLFQAGITTPEELRKVPYADLAKIQGMNTKNFSRVQSVRHQLQIIHDTETRKEQQDHE